MKIRNKLTLAYALVTAALLTAVMLAVVIFSHRNRETEFYSLLQAEGRTKARLYLDMHIDERTLHSIYLNNSQIIDEVEVAIYDRGGRLLYHDATESDIVKETPVMLQNILERGRMDFYAGRYQVTGMVYTHGGQEHIVTAAAYDGYGIAKLRALINLMVCLWVAAMLCVVLAGYYMARRVLMPIGGIVQKTGEITATGLGRRLPGEGSADELGELTRTLNDMLGRLESSFRSQKMFVSNISHELRTPMAALIAELELALMKERSEREYRDSIRMALSDARDLERLSSGLLDLARAGYDAGQMKMGEVRIDELLLDARETVVRAHPEYTVELVFGPMPEDDEPLSVNGNEYLLKTAFVNLMENNCKFSGDRTSGVNISYYEGFAVIRFSDSGIGIPRSEIDGIFEPFRRGSNTKGVPGHGIGLALVRQIVTLHGGSIEVNSQSGEGTVFIMRLPVG